MTSASSCRRRRRARALFVVVVLVLLAGGLFAFGYLRSAQRARRRADLATEAGPIRVEVITPKELSSDRALALAGRRASARGSEALLAQPRLRAQVARRHRRQGQGRPAARRDRHARARRPARPSTRPARVGTREREAGDRAAQLLEVELGSLRDARRSEARRDRRRSSSSRRRRRPTKRPSRRRSRTSPRKKRTCAACKSCKASRR